MKYSIKIFYHHLQYCKKEDLGLMDNPFVEQGPLLRETGI